MSTPFRKTMSLYATMAALRRTTPPIAEVAVSIGRPVGSAADSALTPI